MLFARKKETKDNSGVMSVVYYAVVSRIATLALMIMANALLPTHNPSGVHLFRPTEYPVPAEPGVGGPLAPFTRWDSAWLLSIAEDDYPTASSSESSRQGPKASITVDCAGTSRAWGGGRYRPETQDEEGEGQHRCRTDIALEEQAHAFFPLYPWLVGAAGKGISFLFPRYLGTGECLIVAAVLISNACFVAAALLLYGLGTVVMGDTLLAFRGALAFCVSPASVFFSTAYSESLYAALTFAGLLVLYSGASKKNSTHVEASGLRIQGAVHAWIAAALLSAATLTRSNGIAAAGVLVLEKLRWMAGDAGLFVVNDDNRIERRRSAMARPASKIGRQSVVQQVGCGIRRRGLPWVRLVTCAIATGGQALLIVAPYVFVQIYAYYKFCGETGHSTGGLDVADAGELHPWCTWRLPSLYAYVQSEYWRVGAFKYCQLKQIPNFFLAAPALALTALGATQFFTAQFQGDRPSEWGVRDLAEAVDDAGSAEKHTTRRRWRSAWLTPAAKTFFGPPALPHPAAQPCERSGVAALILQWIFLGAFAALCMNVQVATRFLAASCPPLHWWTATLLFTGNTNSRSAILGKITSSLRRYLVLYFILGAVLHANFLPWT